MADHESTIHPLPAQGSFPELASTQFTEHLLLDSFGTVLEVRRMSPCEARDTNLELEAQDEPYHWVPLSSMGD
jgi:hypothetical protein